MSAADLRRESGLQACSCASDDPAYRAQVLALAEVTSVLNGPRWELAQLLADEARADAITARKHANTGVSRAHEG
jgi:hypothetical protein